MKSKLKRAKKVECRLRRALNYVDRIDEEPRIERIVRNLIKESLDLVSSDVVKSRNPIEEARFEGEIQD